MPMNFRYLCDQYQLGRFRSTAELKPGTSSQVWRLDTDCGAFLVRTLSGREQGEREWNIHRHLRERDFTAMPAILVPYFEQNGLWFQVQEFVRGARPDPASTGTAGAIARMVKELTQALAHCPWVGGADRFDLAVAWQQGREFWSLLETPYTLHQAEDEISRCCAIPEQSAQVIHGDLGPWNMIVDEHGAVFVIDFGEARMGDPYFDFASALGGLINHTSADLRQPVCREFLDELDSDRGRLLEQLRLWVWRGLAQWAILAGNGVPGAKMAARFINALHWAEENLHEL